MPLRPSIRGAGGAALAAAALLGGASPALASHLQGGSITAKVTAAGHLEGTLTYADRSGCTVGQQSNQPITVTAPTSQTASVGVPLTATRCLTGSATYQGTFDVPLDTSSFSSGAPDGAYTATWRSGNRIGGIVNLANSSSGYVSYATQVRKVSMQATGAPAFGSNVANGIAIGSEYKQNLNASDPDGGAVAYETLLKPNDPDAADTDIVALSPSGKVTIPASTTAGFTGGQYYIYKVRATDSQGDYAERDVLLKVASSNHQPAIAGLAASYAVQAGSRLSIPVTATDPDSGDTVSISSGSLPAWATLTATPGNPGTATLAVNPPAGVSGTFGINLDAEDDSNDVALTDAAYVEIKVGGVNPPAAPVITGAPAAKTSATTANLTFTGAGGATFQCRFDGGAWTACTSPYTLTGLKVGTHTFEVRQTDGSGNVSPAAGATFEVVGLDLNTVKGGVTNRRATPVLPDAVDAKTHTTKIPCALPAVTACTIKVYVKIGGKQVLVGQGSATASGSGDSVAVTVKLNARGQRLVNRSGGIKATFKLSAKAGGITVEASKSARMLPSETTTILRRGLKGKEHARYLRSLKRELADAKSVTCVGHTDATSSAKASKVRGLASAKAACATLTKLGVKAKLRTASVGGTQPRATNSTAGGRAFNRRVELKIEY